MAIVAPSASSVMCLGLLSPLHLGWMLLMPRLSMTMLPGCVSALAIRHWTRGLRSSWLLTLVLKGLLVLLLRVHLADIHGISPATCCAGFIGVSVAIIAFG